MSSIYIHIPFCKQACHYCDFHFSTSLKKKPEMVTAILRELEFRKDEVIEEVETIYFGGGTPSLLTKEEISRILDKIDSLFKVVPNPEITLEANPDDLTKQKIKEISETKINRLSIGVQSFSDRDLEFMNRAHSAVEALESVKESKKYFENITIDLMYGVPGMSEKQWIENLNQTLELDIPHISSYVLTVEPKTALKKFIETGKVTPVDDVVSKKHYEILLDFMERHGYENYEFSSFSKPGFHSRNNTAYWEGKSYLGIGPSAHSFDGLSRSWNIANNSIYIRKISENILPSEKEILSVEDKYNEYVMTGLRTNNGVSLSKIEREFGRKFVLYLLDQAKNHFKEGNLILKNDVLEVSRKAKFLTDGLSGDLFYV